MRKLMCENCGKRYDFDVDDFCPRCGSFNQPKNKWRVDSVGNVVRVDGINEKNHAGSFVHKEVHKEKVVRKVKGLDRDGLPQAKKVTAQTLRPKQKASKPVKIAPSIGGAAEKATGKKSTVGTVVGIILAVLALLMEIIFN